MLKQWTLIGALAVFTYLSRLIGLEIMAGRSMNPVLRLYFQYVPVGILSALILKQMLVPADAGLPSFSLPVLGGCLFTAVAIVWTKKFLPSVAVGLLAGLLVRYFL